jgi:hypothetical protein
MTVRLILGWYSYYRRRQNISHNYGVFKKARETWCLLIAKYFVTLQTGERYKRSRKINDSILGYCAFNLCSLVQVDRRFTDAYCLHNQGNGLQIMEAVRASETSVNIYKTTRRSMPEDCYHHTRCRENLKYDKLTKMLTKFNIKLTPYILMATYYFGWFHTSSTFDPQQRQRRFPPASVSRPALRPIHPPIQWVQGVLSPGVKRTRGVKLTTRPHLVPRSRMSRSYTSSPLGSCMSIAGQLYVENNGLNTVEAVTGRKPVLPTEE